MVSETWGTKKLAEKNFNILRDKRKTAVYNGMKFIVDNEVVIRKNKI
jgi:hypothetical protein